MASRWTMTWASSCSPIPTSAARRVGAPSAPTWATGGAGTLCDCRDWHPGIRRLIEHLGESDPATQRPYQLRYSGALVADLHRSLLEGGFYFYPPDAVHDNGKLRLLYECAPLALVVEQAGGRASTGTRRILDIPAETIHQREPLVIGSAVDVALYEQFVAEGAG